MLEAEARRVLGVGASAPLEEVRATFRRLVRHAHPDMVPGDTGAGRATASLVEAYAVLRQVSPRSAAPPPPAPAGPVANAPRRDEVESDGNRLLLPGPPDEVYRQLVDVAHLIGEITYLDPDARLLDTIVITEGTACSLLASLHGRAAATEVHFTIEPLGGEARPAVEPLVTVIADLLAAPA